MAPSAPSPSAPSGQLRSSAPADTDISRRRSEHRRRLTSLSKDIGRIPESGDEPTTPYGKAGSHDGGRPAGEAPVPAPGLPHRIAGAGRYEAAKPPRRNRTIAKACCAAGEVPGAGPGTYHRCIRQSRCDGTGRRLRLLGAARVWASATLKGGSTSAPWYPATAPGAESGTAGTERAGRVPSGGAPQRSRPFAGPGLPAPCMRRRETSG